MNRKLTGPLLVVPVFVLCGVIAAVLLGNWLCGPEPVLAFSLPGMDGGPPEAERHAAGEAEVDLTGNLEQFDGVPSSLPGNWPRFRGADFDNISKSQTRLADRWPESGPELLWSVQLGEGHAAPAVFEGRVYVMDYDEENRADALRCFSLDDGREIWRRSYALPAKRNHGLSRTIPAVTEDCLVTIGPRCHVSCVETKTGTFRWGVDLQKEYGTTEPLWFTGQCPLIDNGLAVLAPGGPDVLLMAVDCKTGETVWQTPNPNGWKMSHSSVMPMTLHGIKMYVYCAVGGITGVSKTGQILWELPWRAPVIAPSPVAVAEDQLFITAGYGAGSLMIRIDKTEAGFTAIEIARHGPRDWLASEQQTPIFHDGLLYGIMPKDSGALRQQWVCYDPIRGELLWSGGRDFRFGLGPFLLADGKFFVLDDDGTLTMLEADRNGFRKLAWHRVLTGHDAWGPIAIAGTRMLLRDSTRMVCIDVGAKE